MCFKEENIVGQFILNGRETPFEKGQTILDAAEQSGVIIPSLCRLKGVKASGNCGVCVVEVDGTMVLSCSTPVSQGMKVLTRTPAIVAARKERIKALLDSGNHNCAVGSADNANWSAFQLSVQNSDGSSDLCPAWGDCRLQDLAYEYQVTGGQPAFQTRTYPQEYDAPLIIRDYSRCIRCGRCVAACNDIQANFAIHTDFLNADPVTSPETAYPVAKDNCVYCGECVQACPVGALVEKKARYDYRPWKAEKIRTTCPYCGVGCQQWLHVVDDRIVKVTGVEDGAPNKGRLCVKGRFGYDFIYSEERLKNPLIRNNDGSFRDASWDEALDLVADRFQKIIREQGPDAIAGVSCARSINEDSYQMQKFFRAVIGTNNIDHCART
jgi:formate dehydrogenase major subunit